MKTKTALIRHSNPANEEKSLSFLVCKDCDCAGFLVYFIDKPECGCLPTDVHAQCVKCGVAYCMKGD